jgi:hypothetical protein
MKLEKVIELIVNTKSEQADKSLNDFKKKVLDHNQTYFRSKRLILNKPVSVKSYINAGLYMKLNEQHFLDEEKLKFKELQIRHIDLFTFIELIKNDNITDKLTELFQNIIDFCPEGKEIRRKKRIAYQFLQENKITETTSNSYFTRRPYTDKILKSIDIPEHQLVQILLDYQSYLVNTEWRNYIIQKEEELERKRNTKKTFVQWLQA